MNTIKRPNILLLFTDQQRKDSLGCYGNPIAITPNIDKLADTGAVFENYYTQSPICMPSRVSLLTGKYCSAHGIGTNGPEVPDSMLTIQKRLKPYGYKTANFGKLHFLPHSYRDHRDKHPDFGFDEHVISDEPGCYDDPYSQWVQHVAPEQLEGIRTSLPPEARRFGKPEYSQQEREPQNPFIFEADEQYTHSSYVAELTNDFLERNENNKNPFFCISGFYAPHTPINPPKRFLDLYEIEHMSKPILGEAEDVMESLRNISPLEWQRIKQFYMALVSHVDDCVGKIVDKLKETNLYDNTIIVFVSDHGEYLGDHGRVQKGMPGEDVITNVPFIIHYPKALTPNRFDQLVESVDWLPTMLEMAGIPVANDIQGKSLKALLQGVTSTHKDLIITEQFEPHGLREVSVRDKQYRYYSNSEGEELLFDLQNDSHELNNVAKEQSHSDALSKMRFKMLQKIQQTAYPNVEKIFEY
ncbi:sulfatase family protein [Vibrio algarum]|uniref:Sulfatase-like hydrolase/transferase n=1 Tax=Vibrio algarum TaxID=3020714 RepID=A0ABT4YUW9_9VIBR|nr:sulfatase-like hydrolase/transferase [Vibrio sp. KJ40-1]MDB1125341.1 sulfatase-like hydrolase/transferase [Vibrio sp. KJ40-1]